MKGNYPTLFICIRGYFWGRESQDNWWDWENCFDQTESHALIEWNRDLGKREYKEQKLLRDGPVKKSEFEFPAVFFILSQAW